MATGEREGHPSHNLRIAGAEFPERPDYYLKAVSAFLG